MLRKVGISFRLMVAMICAGFVSACGIYSESDFTETKVRPKPIARADVKPVKHQTGVRFTKKGDSKPHEGVARAHRMPVQGIDVARYQGDINWPVVKDAGSRFAFIKATEGVDYIDPNFMQNWRGAGSVGIARSAYHFIYWCSPARRQAEWFIRNVPKDPNGLPPVIDAEWNNHSRTCKRRVPPSEALQTIRTISDMMERHYGKTPIIYTDINFHRDVLQGKPMRNHFWLRSTAAEPEERYLNRPWVLWQFTQTGTVPGIRGPVDRNVFHGTEKQWAQFLSGGCDPARNGGKIPRGCNSDGGSDLMIASTAPSLAVPSPPVALTPPIYPPPVAEAFAPEASATDLTAFIEGLQIQ